MPRYSETCESLVAAWPLTGPLVVCTVCPIVQLACLGLNSSREEAKAQVTAPRLRKAEVLMVVAVKGRAMTSKEEEEEEDDADNDEERKR